MSRRINKMNKTTKIVGGVIAAGCLIGAGLSAGFALDQPKTIEVEKEVIVEVPHNVTVEKIVEKNVTVEVPVEFENETFKKMACDRLFYDDLKECQEEVEAEDAALKLAFEAIEADYADELEDADIVKDEDDARLVELYTDFEDVEVKKSDFDDEKYRFVIQAKVEDEDKDNKFKVDFTVEVENGDVEIKSVEKQ